MDLFIKEEKISICPKMSLVQAPILTTESLPNNARILEPSANSSGDAVDVQEKITETTECEDTMESLEQEINDLLADKTSEECNVNKKPIIDTKDQTNKCNKEDSDVTPDKEIIKDDDDSKINEITVLENNKVNGDIENLREIQTNLNKITDIHTPANIEDEKVESKKENDVELNCLNNDTEEEPVNVQQFINQINDLERSTVSHKEVECVEPSSENLAKENSTLVTEDLGQKSENIDDIEQSVRVMEQNTVTKEVGEETESDSGNINCDPVVNGITKAVEPTSKALDAGEQSKESENVNMTEANDASENIDDVEKSVEPMEQDTVNEEIGKKLEPNAGKINRDPIVNDITKDVDTMDIALDEDEQSKENENVNMIKANNKCAAVDSFNDHIKVYTRETVAESYEESLEDFINATDVKEDPNLDIALNEINDDALSKTSDTTDDQLANEVVSHATQVNTEYTADLDTNTQSNTDTEITLSENIAAVKKHNVIANVKDNVDKDNDTTIKFVPNNEDESHKGKNDTTIMIAPVYDNTDKETNTVKSYIPNKNNAKKDSKTRKITSLLANNLDIFSDEEDDSPTPVEKKTEGNKEIIQKEPVQDKTVSPANNKIVQDGGRKKEAKDCVSLVDDEDDNDDVMLIDEDKSSKSDKSKKIPHTETKLGKTADSKMKEDKLTSDNDDDDVAVSTDIFENAASEEGEFVKEPQAIKEETIEPESGAKKIDDKPLVAITFLKSLKTKMNEMTRADLEEFCLLKIVEGVVDRSSLSEIKAKLKTMVQNVEEWRKKAMVLNKQNRDLQIVLRTVQEEQKKKLDEVITPLKITRSVGMQVLMTESKTDTLNRTRGQKRTLPTSQTASTPPQRNAQKISQPVKSIKTPIPVPRLVPAQNSSPIKPGNPRSSPQVQNSTISSNSAGKTATPNGVRTYTPNKSAEKRSYSVSIDLTDDEPPPAKQMATSKAIQNPVRLVPSQQLLAPTHRASLVTNNTKNSNPRQVYIPIGGPQGNMRPGQTIVFKNSPNVRARQPAPGTIVRPNQSGIRTTVPRNQNKHPAPLPQAYSQPQPPNWKALPPAPDLKISKIENGIVVSWKIDGYQESTYEEIVSYQLYAYQETSAPASTFLWNKIGDIKALPLPMACTLTQFIAGYKYYFAVRAVDIRSRIGPFSLPGSILLLNK